MIGVLSFANYALFMHRSGVTLSVDSADPVLYARATTISYLTIAFCQFANILSRRYEHTSLLNANFFSNRILLFSILGSVGLIAVAIHAPYVRDFLHFASPKPIDWLYVLGAAAVYLLVFEVMKGFKRLQRRENGRASPAETEFAKQSGDS